MLPRDEINEHSGETTAPYVASSSVSVGVAGMPASVNAILPPARGSKGPHYVGLGNGNIYGWLLEEVPRCVQELVKHKGAVSSLARCNGMLVSAAYDCAILVWDTTSAQLLYALLGHTDAVTCVLAIGRELFSTSWDGSVRRWECSSHGENRLLLDAEEPVLCLLSIETTGKLFWGGRDGNVGQLDAQSSATDTLGVSRS